MSNLIEEKPSFMVDSDLEILREVERREREYLSWNMKAVPFEDAYISFLKHIKSKQL